MPHSVGLVEVLHPELTCPSGVDLNRPVPWKATAVTARDDGRPPRRAAAGIDGAAVGAASRLQQLRLKIVDLAPA
jgi:hypothetical protein